MCTPVLNFGKSCVLEPTPGKIKAAQKGTMPAILWTKRRSFEIFSPFDWKMEESDGVYSLKDPWGNTKVLKKKFLQFGYPLFPEQIRFSSWEEYQKKMKEVETSVYRRFFDPVG